MVIYWDDELDYLEDKLLEIIPSDERGKIVKEIDGLFRQIVSKDDYTLCLDAFSLLCIWYFEYRTQNLILESPVNWDDGVTYLENTEISYIFKKLLHDLFSMIKASKKLFSAVEAFYDEPEKALTLLLELKKEFNDQFIINYLIALIYIESNQLGKVKYYYDAQLFENIYIGGYETFFPKIDIESPEQLERSIDNANEIERLNREIVDLKLNVEELRKQKIKTIHNSNEIEFEEGIDSLCDEITGMVVSNIKVQNYSSIFEEQLAKSFSPFWNTDLIDDETKKLLITAETIYNFMKDRGDLEFSPATITLTKALEKVYKKLVGDVLLKYCNMKYSEDTKLWPSWIKNKRNEDKVMEFTLGNYKFLFEKFEVVQILQEEGVFAERNTFNQGKKVSSGFFKMMNEITIIRNKVAHIDGITLDTANRCREIMLNGYKILYRGLNKFQL